MQSNSLNVYKVLLVGVTCVAKAGYLSDFNNVNVYPMFHPLFADKFGFTEKEVDILLQHHQKADRRQGDGILGTYWTDTTTTQKIQKLIWYSKATFQDTVARLLAGESIEVKLKNNLYYKYLYHRVDDALWTLLYYTGYLLHKDDPSVNFTLDSQILYHNTVTGIVPRKLRIPNTEVLTQWLRWLQLPGAPLLNSVVEELLKGELQNFHRLLADTIIEDLAFNVVGGLNTGKKSKSFYHRYFLGCLAQAKFTGCIVKSNREGGLSRFDALIEYKQYRQAAIMEYKKT
ncbi:hypothetical protein BC936DRAFT_136907 [Jimgerdemannia flammicorona]|uniref:Uncharacterized protein n=1 Tax=Jimgerdemannia flammicorona TaxID=994334 RepID=A0A433CYJ5_9FUNG|nr:hypothetical protein BC936DRAFT_136907 [Jimgerdemannia flammicorona]